MSKTKKIAYISGTRADFGLMTSVLRAVDQDPCLELNLYATGMHLMSQYGNTIKQVKNQFPSVEILNAKIPVDQIGQAEFFAQLCHQLIAALSKNKPDLLLVLGDRPEMLAVANLALYLRVPVAHIHGGEKTTTVDEIARHAITKLAQLHFPATQTAAERIKRLGEEPWRIKVVGAPALDMIKQTKLLSKQETLTVLGLNSDQPDYLLVTLHPVSQLVDQAQQHMVSVLEAVKKLDYPVVVIYPNADPGSLAMIKVTDKYCNQPRFKIFKSLPYQQFLAAEKHAQVWIGNSSAGIIESPSFKVPVVNVGPRQQGREKAKNIIDVDYDQERLVATIKTALSNDFKKRLKNIRNPWGDGQTAAKIVKVLELTDIDERLLNKQLNY